MAQDQMTIEILPDGRVKITTDQVSPANHLNADEMLKFLARNLGGGVEVQKRKENHVHQKGHVHA